MRKWPFEALVHLKHFFPSVVTLADLNSEGPEGIAVGTVSLKSDPGSVTYE